MERAAQQFAAQRLGALDRPGQVIDRALPALRIGMDRAVLGIRHHGHRGASEAVVADRLAELAEMLDVALEHGHLDAVVAGRLQLGQQRQVLVDNVGGPE